MGKPIPHVDPPPSSAPRPTGRRRTWRAVGVVVATGSIVGVCVALSSGGGPAKRLPTPTPNWLVMPVLNHTGHGWSGVPSTRQAPRADRTSRPHPRPSASPAARSRQTAALPRTTAAAPAIAVSYVIDNKWPNGFQGEVRVTNNGTRAISGWQIELALPQDRFNTWWNTTGQMRNGVLMLHQPSWSGPLEPGKVLHAYVNVTGSQTSPAVCTFDGISCARS